MFVSNSFTYATGNNEDVESTIWSVSSDGAVTAQWVNSDFGRPTTSIVYYEPQNFLLLTGDPAAIQQEYGSSTVVTLTFVPQPPPPLL